MPARLKVAGIKYVNAGFVGVMITWYSKTATNAGRSQLFICFNPWLQAEPKTQWNRPNGRSMNRTSDWQSSLVPTAEL